MILEHVVSMAFLVKGENLPLFWNADPEFAVIIFESYAQTLGSYATDTKFNIGQFLTDSHEDVVNIIAEITGIDGGRD